MLGHKQGVSSAPLAIITYYTMIATNEPIDLIFIICVMCEKSFGAIVVSDFDVGLHLTNYYRSPYAHNL